MRERERADRVGGGGGWLSVGGVGGGGLTPSADRHSSKIINLTYTPAESSLQVIKLGSHNIDNIETKAKEDIII